MKKPDINIVDKQSKFKDEWIEVHQQHFTSNGRDVYYTTVKKNDSVIIIPVDKNKNTILLHQYRYPVDDICPGFPMGRIDDGETPLEAAHRELMEESGIKCDKMISLGNLYSVPALTSQKVHVFVAECHALEKSDLQVLDPEEDILSIDVVPFDILIEKIRHSEIQDQYSISAASLAFFKYLS